MRNGSEAPTGTVARVIAVFRAVVEAGGDVSVAELTETLGLPRPTVHRLLDLLAKEDMVEPDPATRRWGPTVECQRLGALLAARRDLVKLARPVLAEVVERSQEACLLGVYLPRRREMIYAAEHTSPNPLSYRIELNSPVPVNWGASGRSILAFLSGEEIEAILAERAPAPGSGEKAPAASVLRRELESIRQKGFAFSRGQKIPGSRGIAAPILGADAVAVGSLTLTIPEMRFREEAKEQLAEMVMSGAAKLSAMLGHQVPRASSA
ncbi:IclR family transcriptional regulator [Amycolatopsis acidiphila]|uniref:IclR family transcriptional regulator n=1 Tax=Amycolatopsis acidiphila TaxID=715473 RepID=A0A557ZWS1_9PSEU|nr:IclR family transcriptional regulator [Amycolatopsis acidiphila]TVT16454.1 IclR family transcriptional regulator [Amycolatopsis acidiphila]UIJ57912.1 IclR family transcriptional regulator [Amycolatopsis acidiphila]GHG71160.1 transcriptional regulator [Amycolatopsis acidiphila]